MITIKKKYGLLPYKEISNIKYIPSESHLNIFSRINNLLYKSWYLRKPRFDAIQIVGWQIRLAKPLINYIIYGQRVN